MLNWVLSLLVQKDIITIEEARELSRELPLKTHPSNFDDAHRILEKIMKDNSKNR